MAAAIAGKRAVQSLPLRVNAQMRSASRRINKRMPSCLISWNHSAPAGGDVTGEGWQGRMKPAGMGGYAT